MPMNNPPPVETKTERDFVGYVEDCDDIAIKIYRTGWPDRQILMDYGYTFFIEFKRAGKSPRKLQHHIHRELRNKGHVVYWADNLQEAIEYYEEEKIRAARLSKKEHQVYAQQSSRRIVPSSRIGKNDHNPKGC